ncbi:glutaminyl-peptide cyclotransferase [Rasiella rasia]|uniref:Glutaminyl-peptide cyclotransferase n=1 Tax=Rasiella rasia TaxID=2744027 RepID=A0A6G6GJR3_9FLAO|nr:glutaminyl-peptide cyclotransferase [Rasiella rasia]QIE58815.1 glutaminyl-peptide cyclotransferase [Rasiella rasia]
MKFYNGIIFIFLSIFLVSCEEEIKNPNAYFSVEIQDEQKTYTPAETISVSLQNKKNVTISTTKFKFNDTEIVGSSIPLTQQKMGKHTITGTATVDGKDISVEKTITIVAPNKPEIFSYNILETYPHDQNAYTQGLEFSNDTLYESTGQFKESTLRKTDVTTGSVLESLAIGDRYFGEGLTIVDDKIYQLTWRSGSGFIYNKNTFEKTGTFVYGESKEGWGLCNDGKVIYKSDGTEKIWTLDKETLAEKSYIEVYTNKSKIDTINELEWVDNRIYANVYKKDAIAIVNPQTGAVEGVVNLKGLKANVTQHPKLDVLNGIAYKGEPNILYVTGKNWDKLFKIEVVKK